MNVVIDERVVIAPVGTFRDIGTKGVRPFVLHRPDIFEDGHAHNAVGDTSTAVLDDTRFFTTIEAFIDAESGTDKLELLGVLWHVEGLHLGVNPLEPALEFRLQTQLQ